MKAVRKIVDQFVRWYLGWTFRPRLTGAGTSFGNATKPRTRMPTGSSIRVTRHAERSLRVAT